MKKIITLLVVCFITLTSCSKTNNHSISKKEAIEIFKNLKLIQPKNVALAIIDGEEKIVCIATKPGPENTNPFSEKYFIYILSKFADTWRVESEKEIISREYETISVDGYDFEITELDNKVYLYFIYVTGPVGSAMRYSDYNFSLVSLSDFTISELVYHNDEISDEHDFTNIEDFKNKPNILKFLEERASKSEYVYKPNKEDLNMNNPKNYEKKWKIDNPNIPTVYDDNTASNNTIKVTYYAENIFPDMEEDSFNLSKIENENYTIITLLRNNVLGYDKVKNKYFPIWVESCGRGCNKEIEFVERNKLKITWEAQIGAIIVDLKSMNFEIYKR